MLIHMDKKLWNVIFGIFFFNTYEIKTYETCTMQF